MSGRRLTSDDLARAVFSAADTAGDAVPREQTTMVVNELGRLCAGRGIVGLADALIDGAVVYIFTIVGEQAYLLRWHDGLEVAFLGQLRGLKYLERTSGIGAMVGFEGEPQLQIMIEHCRLPGPAVIEAKEAWRVELVAPLREALRMWVSEPNVVETL